MHKSRPARLCAPNGVAETGDVGGVIGRLRDPGFDHRQARRLCLCVQQLAANALHRNAVEAFGQRGEQAHHVEFATLAQRMQRPRSILAAAP